jgi:hypothetical protein
MSKPLLNAPDVVVSHHQLPETVAPYVLLIGVHVPLRYVVQKSEAPDLSQDKRSRQEKPLDFLVQQAAVDSATKWRRVYQLGR